MNEAGLLACVLLLTFPSANADSGFVDNNKLDSLQLREQLWFLTKFPFNAILKNRIATLIRL